MGFMLLSASYSQQLFLQPSPMISSLPLIIQPQNSLSGIGIQWMPYGSSSSYAIIHCLHCLVLVAQSLAFLMVLSSLWPCDGHYLYYLQIYLYRYYLGIALFGYLKWLWQLMAFIDVFNNGLYWLLSCMPYWLCIIAFSMPL